MSATAPHGLKRGVLISTPRDSDKVVECDLIQCCHCQYTIVWQPGLERGWQVCWRCHDWHCPKPECQRCRPWRQMIDNMEAGRDPNHVPVVASVTHHPPIRSKEESEAANKSGVELFGTVSPASSEAEEPEEVFEERQRIEREEEYGSRDLGEITGDSR